MYCTYREHIPCETTNKTEEMKKRSGLKNRDVDSKIKCKVQMLANKCYLF